MVGLSSHEEITTGGPITRAVTGKRCEILLYKLVLPVLQQRHYVDCVTFMQDASPPHIALHP